MENVLFRFEQVSGGKGAARSAANARSVAQKTPAAHSLEPHNFEEPSFATSFERSVARTVEDKRPRALDSFESAKAALSPRLSTGLAKILGSGR
jgi:hypothetical protein